MIWAWLLRTLLCLLALLMWWERPCYSVTFGTFPRYSTSLAEASPNPDLSINEVEDPNVIAGTVQLKETLSACDGLLVVWVPHRK